MNIVLETICVRLTTRCDLACPHCWSHTNGPQADLQLETLTNFLDSLRTIGLKHVSLSGGEPTLYPHLLSLTDYLVNEGYRVSITTNGMDSSWVNHLINRLGESRASEVIVRVSLDGWRSLHDLRRGLGTFDLATAAANHIADSLGQVSINTVVSCPPTDVASLTFRGSYFMGIKTHV